jgi:transposase
MEVKMIKETKIQDLNNKEENSKSKIEIREKYLPVGMDLHEDTCGVVILHPDSGNDTILKSFIMDNCNFEDADYLINTGYEVAKSFKIKPVFILEATNIFWRPLFSYLKRKGHLVHTVSSTQVHNLRKTKTRKTKTDLIDAKLCCQLYKNNESHPTEFPSGIRMDLRELVRLHYFLRDVKGRILNRIYGYLFQVFPELTSLFLKEKERKEKKRPRINNTILRLIKENLAHPYYLQRTRIDKLTNILKRASGGRFGIEKAKELKNASKSSFGIPEGRDGFCNCMGKLASLYEYIENMLEILEEEQLNPLVDKISNTLSTIKGLGIAKAYFLAESREIKDYRDSEDALAWFGLDPRISQSGRDAGEGKHISKSGTKYGREGMFVGLRGVMLHTPVVRKKYYQLRKSGCKDKEARTILTGDLVKSCYAMQRDNVPFKPELFH